MSLLAGVNQGVYISSLFINLIIKANQKKKKKFGDIFKL